MDANHNYVTMRDGLILVATHMKTINELYYSNLVGPFTRQLANNGLQFTCESAGLGGQKIRKNHGSRSTCEAKPNATADWILPCSLY